MAVALILVAAERAKDFPQKPVYSSAPARVSRRRWSAKCRILPPRAFGVADPTAFAEACITDKDVNRLVIYDALAHLPIYGLGDLGFVPRATRELSLPSATPPRRRLPLSTNGGGLSYMHPGMYGLQESVRQMRGNAPAQIPNAMISVCHGVGGMFAASATTIMSNEPP